jgi:hypothetical protein
VSRLSLYVFGCREWPIRRHAFPFHAKPQEKKREKDSLENG